MDAAETPILLAALAGTRKSIKQLQSEVSGLVQAPLRSDDGSSSDGGGSSDRSSDRSPEHRYGAALARHTVQLEGQVAKLAQFATHKGAVEKQMEKRMAALSAENRKLSQMLQHHYSNAEQLLHQDRRRPAPPSSETALQSGSRSPRKGGAKERARVGYKESKGYKDLKSQSARLAGKSLPQLRAEPPTEPHGAETNRETKRERAWRRREHEGAKLLVIDAARAQATEVQRLVDSELQKQASQLQAQAKEAMCAKDAKLRYKEEQLSEQAAELTRLAAVVAKQRDGPALPGTEQKVLRLKHENKELTTETSKLTEQVVSLQQELKLLRPIATIYRKNADYTDRALLFAAMIGDIDEVHRWLEAGTDPNSERLASWTPLHYASYRGDTNMIEVLLQYGAKPAPRDKHDETPLMQCIVWGHQESAGFLRAKGGGETEGVVCIGTTQSTKAEVNAWRAGSGHVTLICSAPEQSKSRRNGRQDNVLEGLLQLCDRSTFEQKNDLVCAFAFGSSATADHRDAGVERTVPACCHSLTCTCGNDWRREDLFRHGPVEWSNPESVCGSVWFKKYCADLRKAIKTAAHQRRVEHIELLSIEGGPVSQIEKLHLPAIASQAVKDLQKKGVSISMIGDVKATRIKLYITPISVDAYFRRWMDDWLAAAMKSPVWRLQVRDVLKVGHFAQDSSGSGELGNRMLVVCVEMVDETFAVLVRNGQDDKTSVDITLKQKLTLMDESQLTVKGRVPWIKRLGTNDGVRLEVAEAAGLSQERTRVVLDEWKDLLAVTLMEAMRRERMRTEGAEQRAGKKLKASFLIAGPDVTTTDTPADGTHVTLKADESNVGGYMQTAVCGLVNSDGTGGPYMVSGHHFLEIKIESWNACITKDRYGTVSNSTHWRDAGIGVVGREYDPRGPDALPAGKSPHGWTMNFFSGNLLHDEKRIEWEGGGPVHEGDLLGLMLDVEQGSLSVWVNHHFRGVLVQSGLVQPLRWAVDLGYENTVVATSSTPPPQRTDPEDPYVESFTSRRAGRRRGIAR